MTATPHSDPGQRHRAFVLRIQDPDATLLELARFFQERRIHPEQFHLHRFRDGQASVILHCCLEKDRLARTAHMLAALPGVLALDRLEER